MGVELQKSSLVRLFININYDYCYAIVITFYSCTRRYGTKALHAIFDVVPRIALGSIVAYIIGQHIDVFIFSLIKKYLVLIKRFSSVHMVVHFKLNNWYSFICSYRFYRKFTWYSCIWNIYYNLRIKISFNSFQCTIWIYC